MSEDDVLKEFGPRCPDDTVGCPTCDAWREYDAQTKPKKKEINNASIR